MKIIKILLKIRKDIVIAKENTSVLWLAGETFRSLISIV